MENLVMDFNDISQDHPLYRTIRVMRKMGVVAGYPDNTFRLEELTPERLLHFMGRMMFISNLALKGILSDILGSVITIETPIIVDGQNKVKLASGFYVDNTHIITNYHAVSDATGTIKMTEEEYSDDLKLIGYDTILDLALLSAPHCSFPLRVCHEPVEAGQYIAVVGSPLGMYSDNTSAGIVRHHNQPDNLFYGGDTFMVDATVNPGNSGGPVIDGYGRVRGVIRTKIVGVEVEGMGFAVKGEKAWEFCSRYGVNV